MSVHEKLVVDLQPVSNVFFSHTFWKKLSVLMLHYSAHLFLAGFTVLLLFNDTASFICHSYKLHTTSSVETASFNNRRLDRSIYYEYQNLICN
jgi:hypothetical protein